ncbi:uncharacterized protein LOC100889319 isoform X2 [Strongylocentrotus purpuratus]|uniref:Uncharacterized protein n=1 Tax=Strongylocentrotus purpuratus TaxID=7668 RepID=A0A7M7PB09_STRPU|nr:uncharacterized protein LOC100889319 isoform X2 [Strongylocentrotus purpuratus]
MTSTSNPAPVTSFVYGTPQAQNEPCSSYLAPIKTTAIIQLVGGCLLVVLGIVAIILMARMSYFATAIWSGILIFGVTGVIGIVAGNNGNKCLVRTYLGMSIVGCLMGLALFFMYMFGAILEGQWRYSWENGYYYPWPGCQPGNYYSWIPNCAYSEAARVTFNCLISITGCLLFVTCTVSASYGCCASCKGYESYCKKCCCNGSGCGQCCTPAPQPVTAIFQAQGPTVATQGHQQAGMYIVQQGPAPVIQYPQVAMPMPATTNQGQAPYHVVSPAIQAPPQPQPIPGHMHAQQPNPVAPPTYYDAGQFPPVELPESKA